MLGGVDVVVGHVEVECDQACLGEADFSCYCRIREALKTRLANPMVGLPGPILDGLSV